MSSGQLIVLYFRNRRKTEIVRTPMVPLSMPQKLRFNITPEVKRDIEKAKQNMNMYVKFNNDNDNYHCPSLNVRHFVQLSLFLVSLEWCKT